MGMNIMKHRLLFIALLVVSTLLVGVKASADDYHSSLIPGEDGYTTLSWTIVEAPKDAFGLYWMEGGAFLATNGSTMSFTITEIDTYIEGELTIGNFTGVANNTEVAQDLLLSVWGLTPFFPGLVVKIGEDHFGTLNETAYAAAEHLPGNYVNGTMESSYETLTIGGVDYDCLVFDYEQDPPIWGEPQETYLAYHLDTGVLIRAVTSVSFMQPYKLVLEFKSLTTPIPSILILGAIGGGILIVIVILVIVKMRK
jgi:hypothetical protein